MWLTCTKLPSPPPPPSPPHYLRLRKALPSCPCETQSRANFLATLALLACVELGGDAGRQGRAPSAVGSQLNTLGCRGRQTNTNSARTRENDSSSRLPTYLPARPGKRHPSPLSSYFTTVPSLFPPPPPPLPSSSSLAFLVFDSACVCL